MALLIVLLTMSPQSHATFGSWLRTVCEKHLIAQHPDDEPRVWSKDDQTILIKKYREIGAKVYWGNRGLREELSALGVQLSIMDRDDARDALRDYGMFE